MLQNNNTDTYVTPYKLNSSYLYSSNNGLICFDSQQIKQLKFDSNAHKFTKWKWKHVCNLLLKIIYTCLQL